MTNINDVAKAAGVSKSTVSNVFSQKRPISKEVRERVLAVAKELHYKPNYLARSLAIKETKIIGLNMVGEKIKFSQFHLSFINGVLSECYHQGYRLLVNTLPDHYREQVIHVASNPTDGEIILAPSMNDNRIIESVEKNTPVVVVGIPPTPYENQLSYVDNNNFPAAVQVTDYLISLGHRNFLFLNAPKIRTVSQEREIGHVASLDKNGVPVNQRFIIPRNEKLTSVEFGYVTAKKMLVENKELTAVITDNDKVALGVYRACAELGIQIPKQLSIIAFSDGSVYASEFSPPLTNMKLNGEKLGREAAKLLIEQIKSSEQIVKRVIIPIELEERGSTSNIQT
ncbi:LacI family DNA-binding transcriptional regulator [Alkalihalobacterium bogoriense]|uniref:LacI family DNA-binding transcriptional regulator n=1 Tax=Alkalihalobacterium bogoriense TaxID=246272 RepID=UPI00047D6814|nr:LacI family DNA-binding transcriptional regulator [Alkalihalobacterium bogoriense]